MTTSGERLKEIRWALKLSQKQMADKLVLTQAAISAVEKGISKSLSVDSLVKLLTEYNINLNWLLGGEGEMFNSKEDKNLDKKVEQKVAEALNKYGLTDIIK